MTCLCHCYSIRYCKTCNKNTYIPDINIKRFNEDFNTLKCFIVNFVIFWHEQEIVFC